MKVYTLSIRSKPLAFLTGFVVLGAGLALLTIGLAILAGIAIAGGVVGLGIMAYRAVRGPRHPPLGNAQSVSGLDPSLEVFADPQAIDTSAHAEPNEDPRRIGPS